MAMSIQINGHRSGFFTPSPGLRQGDPLSPFLFLLCAEGFSYIIKNANLYGFKTAQHCPTVSHLMFADDSIIFSKASEGEARAISDLLTLYSSVSGQAINLGKSSLVFSPNILSILKQSIATILQISLVDVYDKFLGLPCIMPKSKKQAFEFIKDRIALKCAG